MQPEIDVAHAHRVEVVALARGDGKAEWDVSMSYRALREDRDRSVRGRLAVPYDAPRDAPVQRAGREQQGRRHDHASGALAFAARLGREDSEGQPRDRVEVFRGVRHPSPPQQESVVGVVKQVRDAWLPRQLPKQPHAFFLGQVRALRHAHVRRSPGEDRGVRGRLAAFARQVAARQLGHDRRELGARMRLSQRLGEEARFLFPFHEQGFEQVRAVAEVPIEAALGDAEVARQHLHANAVRAAMQQREPCRAHPVFSGESVHTVAYGTSPRGVMSIRHRMVRRRPAGGVLLLSVSRY